MQPGRRLAKPLFFNRLLIDCKEKGYKCHVLDLTCTIDCDGTVYPCCYLFDDTVDIPVVRPAIGLLSNPKGILPWEYHQDALSHIWRNRKLWRDRGLPVEQSACARCTRHLHQNEFLNRFREILDEGAPLKLAEKLQGTLHEDKYFWL